MITNPTAAIRMLITYAICIPLAVVVGYMLTNPMDYGTVGFLGIVLALIISPIFIKWHYPIMVFGLALPAHFFFLMGNPPCWHVVVLLSLGLAVIERTINSEKRFLSVPSMTWSLIVTLGVVIFTAWMTGGFGFHQLGGATGGGGKYLMVLIGIAGYFALTSRGIPREQWKFYVGLYFFGALPSFISDLFPVLPAPLNYINLLISPSQSGDQELAVGVTRLGALSTTAAAILFYLLARYGLRGIFSGTSIFRACVFIVVFLVSMLGGFRTILITNLIILFLLFFFEGLHRSRLLPVTVLGLILMTVLLVPFASRLPFTFQRSLAVFPLHLDPEARLAAEATSQWRLEMWHDVWPKVPQYLLLGKGYILTADDFAMMGTSVFAGANLAMDKSSAGLGASLDYHSGPLSTLIPFGIWGALAFLLFSLTGLRVLYRNFKYGDPELKPINAFLLAWYIQRCITFIFIFGGFELDTGLLVRTVGFSVALNWGMCGPSRAAAQAQPRPVADPPQRQPLPA